MLQPILWLGVLSPWLFDEVNAVASFDPFVCKVHRAVPDSGFILTEALQVLSMQSAFALLESGSVRRINAANVMMKNLVDLSFGCIAFAAFGWGLSFGTDLEKTTNPFCGTGDWFLTTLDDPGKFIFQFSFAAATATIFAGASAERMKFKVYLIFTFIITGVLYPLSAHWAWDEAGWLRNLGFVDFAGGGVIHLLGGASALVSALILGPRLGRFPKGNLAKSTLKVLVRDGVQLDLRRDDALDPHFGVFVRIRFSEALKQTSVVGLSFSRRGVVNEVIWNEARSMAMPDRLQQGIQTVC